MPSINLWTIRVGIFAVVLVFTIIVLGLAASFISGFNSNIQPVFGNVSQPAWAGLAVATTVFTVVGIVPMLVVDFVRRGAVTSWIVVESAVLGVLSIFWLATAADATGNSLNSVVGLPGGCGAFKSAARTISNGNTGGSPEISAAESAVIFLLNEAASLCRQQQAVEAFSFINWLLLMGYTIALVIFALYAKSHGNYGIWTSTVRETDFFKRGSYGNSVPMQHANTPGYASQLNAGVVS